MNISGSKIGCGFFLFFLVIIGCDILLSSFFDKEVSRMIENSEKFTIEPSTFLKVDWTPVTQTGGISYWEDFLNEDSFPYNRQEQKECQILALGDSFLAGSGVNGEGDFIENLEKSYFKNTQSVNLGIPGATFEQEMIAYSKYGFGDDTDLLIWGVFEGDFDMYKLVEGILYNSRVKVIDGYPKPFNIIPSSLNKKLIKYSYVYNKILIMTSEQNYTYKTIENREYILKKVDRVINDFLSKDPNKKLLFVFNIGFRHKGDQWNKKSADYEIIQKYFAGNPNIHFLFLHDMFTKDTIEKYQYDDCCHYNEDGHKKIAKHIAEYIKKHSLLSKKCL